MQAAKGEGAFTPAGKSKADSSKKRSTRTKKQQEKEAEKLAKIEKAASLKSPSTVSKEYDYDGLIDHFKNGCPSLDKITMNCKYYQCNPEKKLTRQEYKDHIQNECQGML